MSDENKTEQISEDHAKAIDHALGEIDLSKVSVHDVFIDFVNRAKRFNFEMMCAMRLIEKILIAQNTTNEDEGQRVES
jgi:hypothetical protein